MSPAVVPHMDTVLSIVTKIYEREPTDNMDDLDVNAAIWAIFQNTTHQAAVHFVRDYEVTLRFVKNHLWKSVEQLFQRKWKTDELLDRNHWCDHD